MLTKFKSNRLGEILVRKGIITREQLKIAIHEQNHRRKILHSTHSHVRQSTCLGEVLTELGFIDRAQLKRGLNWQLILRKITMALALCAPLMGAGYAKAAASTKTISAIPATVQAEGFSTAGGVLNEVTTDVGGGFDTGSIHTGDWMNYLDNQVNIPVAGEYIVSYRVSSLNGGGSFLFNNVGGSITKIDRVSVPKTGGWQTWITVQRKITLKAGPHYFNIQAVVGGFNLNWFRITSLTTSSTKPSTSTAASSKASVASSAVASSKSSSSAAAVKSSVQASSKVSSASSAPAPVSSSKASSASSKSSVASSKSSAATSSSKSTSSVNSGYTHVEGPLGLAWLAPKQREDKTVLDITELGGYQLRYKSLATSKYIYVTINDPWATTYNFTWLEGDYMFEIAAFDKLGMLSDFSSFTSE